MKSSTFAPGFFIAVKLGDFFEVLEPSVNPSE